jgi:hypothetical protein
VLRPLRARDDWAQRLVPSEKPLHGATGERVGTAEDAFPSAAKGPLAIGHSSLADAAPVLVVEQTDATCPTGPVSHRRRA